MEHLTDPFARAITYLRVSVTDRCDFRCSYCMDEGTRFLPRADLLTLEELDRLCAVFIGLGVRKLRLTGGEPLLRRNVMRLFRGLSRHLETGALHELTLTTNGSTLAAHAADLAACGVKRVNVSLDSLRAERFAAITRRGDLAAVLAGIAAARAAGLRVKINTVALRGVNEDELRDLAAWAAAEGHDLSFIEVMPVGEMPMQDRAATFLSLAEVRARLSDHLTLTDLPETTGGPARYVRATETGQRIGFITPLSHGFCASCNRVRISATGTLFPCLGQEGGTDLRAALRGSESDTALTRAIRAAIGRKPRGHDFGYGATGISGRVGRGMNQTGG